MSCSVSGCTNRIAFLSFVRECEGIKGHKGMNIVRINIEEKGGVRNVK